MEMYGRLVKYNKKHKSTLIPARYQPDPELGYWATEQRRKCKSKSLPQNRIDLLNEIDFAWTVKKGWMEMYNHLIEYHKEHKSTLVPAIYQPDPQLGRWIMNRRRYCKGQDRIDLLNKIDFAWAAKGVGV